MLKNIASGFGKGIGESFNIVKDVTNVISEYLRSEKGQHFMAKHFEVIYEETQPYEEVLMEALNEMKGK
jgi:single-stranded DNA-specific DHH superfamily exonuclease